MQYELQAALASLGSLPLPRDDFEDIAPFLAAAFGVGIASFSFCLGFLIEVFLCWLLWRCLSALPAGSRRFSPALVWLLLVPCFSTFWGLYVYPSVSRSFQSHFETLGRRDIGGCGFGYGLGYALCVLLSWVPCVSCVAGPAAFVFLILYMIEIHTLAALARMTPAAGR